MVVDTPLRWGIVSTARIGDEIVPCLHQSVTSSVVAVASRNLDIARSWAHRHDVPLAFGSYDELLERGDIDCVYISLPNALHGEWVRKALESGKHVLCEKPLTVTSGEADDLFKLADRQGLVLDEAFMYRHHPQTLKVRELARGGTLGELRVIRCAFYFEVKEPDEDIRYRPELSGGSLRDVGSYCVSFANFIADAEPTEVMGIAMLTPSGIDERFAALLIYDSGLIAEIDCGMDTELHVGASILGSTAHVWVPNPWYPDIEGPWRPGEPPMMIRVTRTTGVEEIATGARNAYLEEIEAFARAVRGDKAGTVPPDETLRTLRTIERLHEAAITRSSRGSTAR